MSERFNKEAAYDAEIYPLMSKIIRICQREAIPMVASFHLRDVAEDEDAEGDGEDCGDLTCTTALTAYENTPDAFRAAHSGIMRRKSGLLAFTITAKPEVTA